MPLPEDEEQAAAGRKAAELVPRGAIHRHGRSPRRGAKAAAITLLVALLAPAPVRCSSLCSVAFFLASSYYRPLPGHLLFFIYNSILTTSGKKRNEGLEVASELHHLGRAAHTL